MFWKLAFRLRLRFKRRDEGIEGRLELRKGSEESTNEMDGGIYDCERDNRTLMVLGIEMILMSAILSVHVIHQS